jgi:hypothetical protein
LRLLHIIESKVFRLAWSIYKSVADEYEGETEGGTTGKTGQGLYSRISRKVSTIWLLRASYFLRISSSLVVVGSWNFC